MSGGSLRKYLHQQEPHSVPLNLVLRLSLDVARGMQYLHSEGILHQDLKSENLLLGEDMVAKELILGFTSTYRWMAPEMIKEEHHTKKVDVYSFGIVLWEILTALIPFADLTPEQAAFAVCQKNARPPLPPNCPRGLSDLIKRCWTANPERRPHFDEIVSILEFYTESFEKDPKFFSSFRPHHNRFLPCFPKITAQLFTSLKA
ncbi:Serine/threonine/tyrosine-protein kinase HT1-like protein [Drosera capensis]